MKKKRILLAAVVVVLLAAGGFAYRTYASSRSDEAGEIQTGEVTTGSLSSTLSSSGNTSAGQSATVSWEISGQVDQVTLKVGDRVEAGQVLAALDGDYLSNDLIQARMDLIEAQQALDDLLNSQVAQAEALQAVEQAQQALDDLKQSAAEQSSQALLALVEAQEALKDAQQNRIKMNYPHSSNELTLEKAETDYLLAKATYKEAQQQYNKYAKKNLTNPDRVQALNRLMDAKTAMDSKLAIWNWYQLDYTEADIAQADAELAVAEANLASAQVAYDRLKDGATSAEQALAEAKLADAQRAYERIKNGPSASEVAAAEAAVETAQAVIDHAQLLAPFAGTITEVDIATGDLVENGDAAIRIDDLDALSIELQISEVDLAVLAVGQPALIEFDAISERSYVGVVTEIGIIGANSQGVVNYPVTVEITDVDENIHPGMTASVTITTEQRDNVMLVPNKAIRTSAGQKTVNVLFEGQQISVPVTVGLVGDSLTEVTSAQLRAGDTVVLQGSTASTTTTTATQGRQEMGAGGFMGGGDMPPGGGGMP